MMTREEGHPTRDSLMRHWLGEARHWLGEAHRELLVPFFSFIIYLIIYLFCFSYFLDVCTLKVEA